MNRRIVSVEIVREPDEPDMADLGTYTASPTHEFSIDREARGDMRRGEYRWFNPTNNYMGCTPDEYRAHAEQDYLRSEAMNRGEWHPVYVYARAKVTLTSSGVIQSIRSGGIGGFASDDDADEGNEEQLGELRDELAACGFDDAAISAAFASAKVRS